MSVFCFFVPGTPQPGGSKRGYVVNGRACITEDNKRSRPWKACVSNVAVGRIPAPLFGPLRVSFKFMVLRPKGHYGKKGVRASAPKWPAVRPDTTKLIRSTEDALKGIAWRDDSQVVEQWAAKVYTDTAAGAWIRIEELLTEEGKSA